jgi:hypothetical protein
MRTVLTRGLLRNFRNATALAEKSRRSTLQLTHFVSVSREDALQSEQVCTAGLLKFLMIVLWAVRSAKVFVRV